MLYTSLTEYTSRMQQAADLCVRYALEGQEEGKYTVSVSALKEVLGMETLDRHLLADMLAERTEIRVWRTEEDTLDLEIVPEFLKREDVGQRKTLSAAEIGCALAKHYLWLQGAAGGEQADFSGCLIQNYRFREADLSSALLEGTKFVHCSLDNAELCFANGTGACFERCTLKGVIAEEAYFHNARFQNCDMTGGVYTHADFSAARFVQTLLTKADFTRAILTYTQWLDSGMANGQTANASGDFPEQEQNDYLHM